MKTTAGVVFSTSGVRSGNPPDVTGAAKIFPKGINIKKPIHVNTKCLIKRVTFFCMLKQNYLCTLMFFRLISFFTRYFQKQSRHVRDLRQLFKLISITSLMESSASKRLRYKLLLLDLISSILFRFSVKGNL